MAESLFRDGKRLSAERRFAEACPKFAESYKLDAGLGTLLNLATCHEAEGKPASAWAEFSEADARAKREGDNERAQLAEERVRALEPKLARITIALAPGAALPGLIIKFDSRELSSAALGLEFPVDPGKHRIEGAAPGKQSYAQTIDAPGPGSSSTLTMPVLLDSVVTPTVAPPVMANPTPTPAPNGAPATGAQPSASRPLSPGIIVTATATGALLVGTVVSGVIYGQKRSSFNTANGELSPDRADKRSSAQTWSTVNLVFAGGTLVSAGLLVYFLATQGEHEAAPTSAKLNILPTLGPNGGGLLLRGAL